MLSEFSDPFKIMGGRCNNFGAHTPAACSLMALQSSAIHTGGCQYIQKQHIWTNQAHNQVRSTILVPNEDKPEARPLAD